MRCNESPTEILILKHRFFNKTDYKKRKSTKNLENSNNLIGALFKKYILKKG